MLNKLKKITNLITQKDIISFMSPYVLLEKKDLTIINKLIYSPEQEYVEEFENALCSFINKDVGEVVSFGAGRMSFYALLLTLGVGKGDEVCLTGFTCAVMANAVLRCGATPIYVDITKDTLGMSPADLKRKISSRTKLVVPQHTFGIPCAIDEIVEIARINNIKVIEDCAISLGSIYKGKPIGTWGDAAIFSTDHTKPLNTLIGGYVYTENLALANALRKYRESIGTLSEKHISLVVKRYCHEEKMERRNHKLFILDQYLVAIKRKLHLTNNMSPYLLHDTNSNTQTNNQYPYPARLHAALAYIGDKSLCQYQDSIVHRKKWLQNVIGTLKGNYEYPAAYDDPNCDIVPLRVVFFKKTEVEAFPYIDDWVWFKRPIIATEENMENFYYHEGDCPTSESVGNMIMNIPMVFEKKKQVCLLNSLNSNR